MRERETNTSGSDRPNFPRWLFWEYRFDEMDWNTGISIIIERVLDRGSDEDWQEMIRYYGRDTVIDILKNAPIYLMDHSIERACNYFNFKPEDLLCYTRKRSRKGHWI